MKAASSAVLKWQGRAGSASGDYVEGAKATSKDQAALAIAAVPLMKQGINEAIDKGRVAKGLQRSGKQGWLAGVEQKGASNYGTGVSSDIARSKYVTNSSRFDQARAAASGQPRGPRGSAQNLQRVTAVVTALRAVKTA